MADAVDVLKNLKQINIKQMCIDTAIEAQQDMVEAMENQLSLGQRADGTDIAPPYTRFTIFEKEKKSGLAAVTDVVTLFDTGEHYSKLFARVKGPDIIFGSKDSKSEALQDKYGEIYGLNDESRDWLVEDVLDPGLKNRIEKLTGLSFER